MKPLTSVETRQAFLEYFKKQGHEIVASSSLVPGNDPTLLFANAGMVQFKDVFLGLDQRPYRRATTAQKCMRISGKHNDLENVGPSPRHHTFFEMLGNFSFGDYFKKDAIRYAFELLTSIYKVPVERLHFTVYRDDDEAFGIWTNEIGMPKERVHRMGPKTNFWQMAETGPCGPTSEIHFDWGPDACTCGEPNCGVPLDNGCERWLEIWNLVFMQYNRTQADPSHSGKFDEALPAPGVDTGMGLERILAVLNSAKANYETDLFADIMDATQEVLGHTDEFRASNELAYRVIADHSRAVAFLIADGVNPGTTGREYVTRMLIRRAWRFAHKMGIESPFLTRVADAVILKMGDIYPELKQFQEAIRYQIGAEEGRFMRMLDNSLIVLDRIVSEAKNGIVSGEDAFFLYDTHGLPLEITRDVLRERQLGVDEAGFHQALDRHRETSRSEREEIDDASLYQMIAAELGDNSVEYNPYDYDNLSVDARVLAIIVEGKRVLTAKKGQEVEVIISRTPFYVESGGQVSDIGELISNDGHVAVSDMRRPVGRLITHMGVVTKGNIKEGDIVSASVDQDRRWDIMRNHTATHLLHASLRRVLGDHVRQKGSLVAPDRLRFDFTHNERLTTDQVQQIALIVNDMVLRNSPVITVEKSLAEAKREGAMALFGEKYGAVVRTITVPEEEGSRFSYELCGGTHVRMTGDIGPCVITSIESSGAGVRRVVALTGHTAQQLIQERHKRLANLSEKLGVDESELGSRINALLEELKDAKAKLAQAEKTGDQASAEDLIKLAKQIDGYTLIAHKVSGADRDQLGTIADNLRDRIATGVIVLASEFDGKALFTVKISSDLQKRGLHAGKLVGELAKLVGGNGGGRPDFASAGGAKPELIDEALIQVKSLVTKALQ